MRTRPAALALVRLLQLASPALPIGAYSYSQGLESAVADGIVRDAATAEAWIGDLLDLVVAAGDAAVIWRLLQACALGVGLNLSNGTPGFALARDLGTARRDRADGRGADQSWQAISACSTSAAAKRRAPRPP